MAKNMKSDYELSGQILLISTLLCIVTIFIGVFLMKTVAWICSVKVKKQLLFLTNLANVELFWPVDLIILIQKSIMVFQK